MSNVSQKIGIIADDLTGASDSGVQLAKQGFKSTVLIDINDSIQTNSDVLVIDTDSRAKPKEAAYKAALRAASLLSTQGYSHIYKKIDSTLRGNITTELDALIEVFHPEIMVVAPAFPKLDRKTINGFQYVNGKLITNTEYSRDPKTPVKESYIPSLLGKSTKEVTLVNLSLLRKSKAEVIDFIEKALKSGQTWFVCDAETEADLQKIAECFACLKKNIAWVGSGGLIEYLPHTLGLASYSKNEQRGNSGR